MNSRDAGFMILGGFVTIALYIVVYAILGGFA